MKICFLLQRRFAVIGLALAKLLNQKYGVEEFCAYVSTRKSYNFIKSQTWPTFTQILLNEDINRLHKTETIDQEFIKKLENDYGLPNLWPYLELDRVIRSNQLVRAYPYDIPRYSHEEMIKIVQVTARAIIKFLDEEKPDVIVFSVVGSLYALLLYEIAKKKNIKTLVIHCCRTNIKHTISENYKNFSFVNDLFNKIQNNEVSFPQHYEAIIKYLEKLREKPKPYRSLDLPKFKPINRRRQFSFLLPKKLLWSIYWRLTMIFRYLKDPYRDDYSNPNPFLEIWDNLKRKIRVLIGFNDLYNKVKPEENFAFFPLHLEPEITTLLYAPFYKDQLWVIKQVARSLPLDFKLYVKEHPAMYGYRTRRFYKELKKIPNVKLLKPAVDTLALVQNAKLILTISGTSGWEAVQLKKPVIIFSDVFYGQLPMVKKCAAIEELPFLVKEQLENFKHDEQALINFLTAIYEESVDLNLSQLWQVESASQVDAKQTEFLPLVALIAKKLGLK